MKDKTLKRITIILLILIALIGITVGLPKLTKSTNLYQQQALSINKDSISTITLSKEDQTINLEKKDGIWQVNGKKADSEKTSGLLEDLLSKDSQLISETDAQHEDLEVTGEKATKVSLGDNQFLVGKSVSGGTYVRLPDSNNVYLLPDLSSANISTDVEDWYDKVIVEIPETDVTKLSFTTPSEEFTLNKQDNTWKIEDSDQEVDQEKANDILANLSFFKARSLPSENDLPDYPNYPNTPDLILTITHSDRSDTLDFFEGEEDTLVLHNEENYIISSFQAENFLISRTDLTSTEN